MRARSGGLFAGTPSFPEKMRQMGECAQADYHARCIADWGWQRLYAERRRSGFRPSATSALS